MCVFFLLSSLVRLSLVSVVFDSNASHNDVTPLFPVLVSVVVNRNKKSELLMDAICVFLLSSLHRLSSMSVMFDSNSSINDFAPMSPVQLTVDVKRKGGKSELLMESIRVSSFFCLHHLDQVQ